MRADEVVRRLHAFHRGAPLPLGETIHFPIPPDPDLLILAFVRMGGESAPWGIAYGHPGERPVLLTVGEPRNRDSVGDMVSIFGPVLLRHFRHPDYSNEQIAGPDHVPPLRQIWLPNPTHLDMLHFLAYAYTFTRSGPAERAPLLKALGRLSGWLFRESRRPGQVTVMVGTDALRESFTFPAESSRQAHLGFLLAWLETRGSRDARLAAAAEAERIPIATSLDPAYEEDRLQPEVEGYNEARRAGNERDSTRAQKAIRGLLEPELRRRYQLTERVISLLRRDKRPVNPGTDQLIRASQEEHWYQYIRLEQNQTDEADGPAFVPSPETDRHPAAAAARYLVHEAAAELYASALLHCDTAIQDLAIAAGDAFRGRVTAVTDEGDGRARRPIWTVETDTRPPLRLREGNDVCIAGLPKRTGRVRRIVVVEGRGYRFDVEITGLKTRPRRSSDPVRDACDPTLVGITVTFVKPSMEGLARSRSQRVWQKDVPGAWLTHAVPAGARARLPEESGEDLLGIDEAVEP